MPTTPETSTPSPKSLNAKRIVIKIGTPLLFDIDLDASHHDELARMTALFNQQYELKNDYIKQITQQIAQLHKQGIEVAIVISGAIQLGYPHVDQSKISHQLEEMQAASAIGQIELIRHYQSAFESHGIKVAQILLTSNDTEAKRRHINARATLNALFKNRIIPLINENDTVATTEIRGGDNDRLAARTAQLISADHLIYLSATVDGIYDDNPYENPEATLIKRHVNLPEILDRKIDSSYSHGSNANSHDPFLIKLEAIKLALNAGCNVLIVNGKKADRLTDVVLRNISHGTIFESEQTSLQARQNWIKRQIVVPGNIQVSQEAENEIRSGKSLLPTHILSINGIFQRGELISITNESDKEIARGFCAYCWKDTTRIRSNQGQDIKESLGFGGRQEIIHFDDLVLLGS